MKKLAQPPTSSFDNIKTLIDMEYFIREKQEITALEEQDWSTFLNPLLHGLKMAILRRLRAVKN